MSKKIIVIITVLSIVMTMVILPISSSAREQVPSGWVIYSLTDSDIFYLFNKGYISLYYFVDGYTSDTGISNNGFNYYKINDNTSLMYTSEYPASGTFNFSFTFHLPFSFYPYSGNIYIADNYFYDYTNTYPMYLYLDDSQVGSYALYNYSISWTTPLTNPRFLAHSISSSDNVGVCDTMGISRSNISYNKVGAAIIFSSFKIYIPYEISQELSSRPDYPSWDPEPSDPGGDPSDPGGDPSDPGGSGSVDFTPLIGYLESLNFENQSTVDTIQSKTDTAIEGLSSSSEQAMDFFNDSESLKTDIIGSTEDYDSFLDGLDLSEEISVTYDGDSYTFDPMQGLDLIGGRIKSLFSFPLFYFIIFMLFFLALASYVIYGRA